MYTFQVCFAISVRFRSRSCYSVIPQSLSAFIDSDRRPKTERKDEIKANRSINDVPLKIRIKIHLIPRSPPTFSTLAAAISIIEGINIVCTQAIYLIFNQRLP